MKSLNLKFVFGLLLLVVAIVIPHIAACHHGPCCGQYSGVCPPGCKRSSGWLGGCTEDETNWWN